MDPTATAELDGTDPHDLLDAEAARIHAFLSTAPDDVWARPTRCEGWTVRDMLGHLAATEDYHEACVEGDVGSYLQRLGEKGAVDLDSANAIGIAELADRGIAELVASWGEHNASNRAALRARGDGMVDTSVGEYPARWQAWHAASELATHADDMDVPETSEEAASRRAWRARFSRFELAESHPELEVTTSEDGTTITGDGRTATLGDARLVEAVAGRDDDLRWILSS